MNRYLALTFASLAAVGMPGKSLAEVRAEVSQTELSQGQAVQLRLDASGSALAMPDLSVLQDDFQIANRNLRQQSSTVNGRRSQRITLTLTLIPLRGGELQIPSIRFGKEASPALKLRVAGASNPEPAPRGGNSVPAWQSPPPSSYGYRSPAAVQPQPSAQLRADAYRLRAGTEGQYARPADDDQPQPAASGARDSGGGWTLAAGGALGLGVLVFLTLLHRGGRRLTQGPPAPPSPAPPPPPLSPALLAVREAYEGDDADAARRALLNWASQTWPDDAPTNLTRLAGRLEGPAREAVLRLDQALYSPAPVAWTETATWQYLGAVKSSR